MTFLLLDEKTVTCQPWDEKTVKEVIVFTTLNVASMGGPVRDRVRPPIRPPAAASTTPW